MNKSGLFMFLGGCLLCGGALVGLRAPDFSLSSATAASVDTAIAYPREEPSPPTTLIEQIRAANLEMDGRSDVRVNRIDAIKDRIARKDGLGEHGQNNMTPLMMAVEENDVEIVQLLLDAEADVYAVDDNGRTVLDASLPWGRETLNQLLHYYTAQNRLPEDWENGKFLSKLLWWGSLDTSFLETALRHGLPVTEADLAKLQGDVARYNSPEKVLQLNTLKRLLADRTAGKLPAPAPVKFALQPPLEDSPLIAAVKAGDAAQAQKLLAAGADANSISATPVTMAKGRIDIDGDARDALGTAAQPALVLAVKAKQPELVKLLLMHGANPDLRGANWRNWGKDGCESPLMLAVKNDDAAMVQMLLGAKANINAPDCQWSLTPLAYAKSIDMAGLLLAAGADIGVKGRYNSVLAQVMYSKNLALFDYLLEHGGDANQRIDGLGWQQTLLMRVADDKNIDAAFARSLLAHGADPAAKDLTGASAFDVATNKGRRDILALLQEKGQSYGNLDGAMRQAIARGDVAEAQKIIAAGLDVKAQPANGMSYLLHAAQTYQYSQPYQTGAAPRPDAQTTAMLRLLLAKGAVATERDSNNRTLVHLVANPEFAAEVIKAGVNINARDTIYEQTALHQYARVANVAMVKALLALGANVNLSDKRGKTALMLALGGPIDHQPSDGPPPNWPVEVPLYLETLRLLKAAGASVSAAEFDAATQPPYGHSSPEHQAFVAQAKALLLGN